MLLFVGLFVFVVFMVFVVLYESWRVLLFVLMIVLFGMIGVIVVVFVCGMLNDVYFKVGMIMVVGLVVKNVILIV